MLATLGPQELPVAEQLLRGGIPAVRQALAEQRTSRPGDAGAEVNRDAVLAVAEQLLPRVNLATWKDRAASAQAAGKEFRLRELRAVVTSARTVSLDDEARTMSRALQESLDQRVRALREEWLGRMTKALDSGRVSDAVRVASRAPEPAMRLPAELAVRIAEASGEAMTADTPQAEWIALLDAVVETPVRRNVKPRGIPEDAQAKEAARRAAGLVPELAKLLGLRIPPPPPRRPTSAVGGFGGFGGSGGGASGGPRRPGGRGAASRRPPGGVQSRAGGSGEAGDAAGGNLAVVDPAGGGGNPAEGAGTPGGGDAATATATMTAPQAPEASVSAAGDEAPADVR